MVVGKLFLLAFFTYCFSTLLICLLNNYLFLFSYVSYPSPHSLFPSPPPSPLSLLSLTSSLPHRTSILCTNLQLKKLTTQLMANRKLTHPCFVDVVAFATAKPSWVVRWLDNVCSHYFLTINTVLISLQLVKLNIY